MTRTLLYVAFIGLSACSPAATPTWFIPPTAAPLLPTAPVSAGAGSPAASPTVAPTLTAPAVTSTPCTNNLNFVQDLTIPDGTAVAAGESVDKQWLVTNSGTCNWDVAYRLKLISGEAMGAVTEQALYPARAGSQVTLRIVFTAPPTSGLHETAWQAFAPDGTAFGDSVYMQINVSP